MFIAGIQKRQGIAKGVNKVVSKLEYIMTGCILQHERQGPIKPFVLILK